MTTTEQEQVTLEQSSIQCTPPPPMAPFVPRPMVNPVPDLNLTSVLSSPAPAPDHDDAVPEDPHCAVPVQPSPSPAKAKKKPVSRKRRRRNPSPQPSPAKSPIPLLRVVRNKETDSLMALSKMIRKSRRIREQGLN